MSRQCPPSEIVTALFRYLLGREPDDSGLLTYCDALEAGVSIEEMMITMSRSEEFRRQFYAFVRRTD